MDLRIGAKSLVYSARQASRVTNKELKQSFAQKMAETKPINQDTVEISGNLLTQRLENVHQKINEMDFTGKTSEEVYKSIVDAYEEDFGFLDNLFYTDKDSYDKIYADKQRVIENTVPNYPNVKNGLHYRAMGYDKMTNEEKIAAIKERIGGNSYIDKFSTLGELKRAGVITHHQCLETFVCLQRKAEREYCAENKFDYLTWTVHPEKYTGLSLEETLVRQSKAVMSWAAKHETTWLEVIESVQNYSAMHSWEKDIFFNEIEEVSGLLIRSDKE